MSSLTEYQIRAMISRLESALELYLKRGKKSQAQVTRRRLAKYREELAAVIALPANEQRERQRACTSSHPEG
jgi:hypothetical protein